MFLLFPEGWSQRGCLFPNTPHVCCGEQRAWPVHRGSMRVTAHATARPWLGHPGLSALSALGSQGQLRGWIRTQNLAGQRKGAPPYQSAFLTLPWVPLPKCILVSAIAGPLRVHQPPPTVAHPALCPREAPRLLCESENVDGGEGSRVLAECRPRWRMPPPQIPSNSLLGHCSLSTQQMRKLRQRGRVLCPGWTLHSHLPLPRACDPIPRHEASDTRGGWGVQVPAAEPREQMRSLGSSGWRGTRTQVSDS